MISRVQFESQGTAIAGIAGAGLAREADPCPDYWPSSRSLPESRDKNLVPYGDNSYSCTRHFRGDDAVRRVFQDRTTEYEARSLLNLPRCGADDEYERNLSAYLRWEREAWTKVKVEGVREKTTKPRKDRDTSTYGTDQHFSGKIGFIRHDKNYIPAMLEGERQPTPPPDRARPEAPVNIVDVPMQPEHLRSRGANDRSYYDYKKMQWFAERTFSIPYKADASTHKRPFITREKELIGALEFDSRWQIWRKQHGRIEEGVWKFKAQDPNDLYFQPPYYDRGELGLNHDNTDGSNDIVAFARHAILKYDHGEKYNLADEYVVGRESVFIPGNEGLHPLEAFTGEPHDDRFSIYLNSSDEDPMKTIRFAIPPPSPLSGSHPGDPSPARSESWKNFDDLCANRRVEYLHETDKYGIYPNPIFSRLTRFFNGMDRTGNEPVPAVLRVPTKHRKTKLVAALLVPPLLTSEEEREAKRLERFWNTGVRNRILLDIEGQNRSDDASFEAIRREAFNLKAYYDDRMQRGFPLDHECDKYLESLDWYNALANDSIGSPSVDRDFGKCRYAPEIRGVYFSYRSGASATPGIEGKWYDNVFPGPKQSKKPVVGLGISQADVDETFKNKKQRKGIKNTMRNLHGKITTRAAAAAEGISVGAMKQRKLRLRADVKDATAVDSNFERLSDPDLIRVMTERGFYVVLPPTRQGYADVLIPVDVAVSDRDLSNPISIGALLATKKDEVIGGVYMDAFRGAVNKIRGRAGRRANQDRAIESVKKRLAKQFERAQLLYFGERQDPEKA